MGIPAHLAVIDEAVEVLDAAEFFAEQAFTSKGWIGLFDRDADGDGVGDSDWLWITGDAYDVNVLGIVREEAGTSGSSLCATVNSSEILKRAECLGNATPSSLCEWDGLMEVTPAPGDPE